MKRGDTPLTTESVGHMTETDMDEDKESAAPAAPRRGPGHRGADMRDTVAEMAERAQLISQEAGSKVASAMKDVISAAAGLAGFAIESARDLVQYMVRRGQMTQEEADKLIREAEEAHGTKSASERGRPTATKIAADKAAVDKAARDAANAAAMLLAPPQRPGAFSLRTGGPRPMVQPTPVPTQPTVPATPAAPVKPAATARTTAKSEPAKQAPKAATKSAAKPPARPLKAQSAATKPTAKAGKPMKAGTKAAPKSKPAGKSAKPPAKKKR
jgi:polyhydroxyalkanoate synthesis regulator phasin